VILLPNTFLLSSEGYAIRKLSDDWLSLERDNGDIELINVFGTPRLNLYPICYYLLSPPLLLLELDKICPIIDFLRPVASMPPTL
jgi:hypothetical protein